MVMLTRIDKLIWLTAFPEPISLYDLSTKLYSPDIGKEPTSRYVYERIPYLIEGGYMIEEGGKFLSTTNPAIEEISKRLEKIDETPLSKQEEEILRKVIGSTEMRQFYKSMLEKVEPRENLRRDDAVELFIDIFIAFLIGFRSSFYGEKHRRTKEGMKETINRVSIRRYKRLIEKYEDKEQFPSYENVDFSSLILVIDNITKPLYGKLCKIRSELIETLSSMLSTGMEIAKIEQGESQHKN